jgi:hypothetical protein
MLNLLIQSPDHHVHDLMSLQSPEQPVHVSLHFNGGGRGKIVYQLRIVKKRVLDAFAGQAEPDWFFVPSSAEGKWGVVGGPN